MKTWSKWFPSANSWMSAVLLVLLMRGISEVVKIIMSLGDSIAHISPKLTLVFYCAALLSPILVIAVTHHLLHGVFDRWFPETRIPEVNPVQGFFPSLMSWWEGLFGWQTIALITLVGSLFQFLFVPSFNSLSYSLFHNVFGAWDELKEFFKVANLVRLLTAAYLYQFEHLVRQHLIAIGAQASSES
ncbi:hypothetical protein IQ235_02540 [Oscillatoriales cyanobacterium LEGE 11467]|uniref:Uncharacterized protein n=1 Tax=Zarconia navalis LEGE 11467 TaxID=1828826 RepID=A0A928VWY2_9CYAN|nr:hypothetical protein [Zarconia navalis]MBE9039673.1 hypothetical protein [Zarconia navalis LEGE 11467]